VSGTAVGTTPPKRSHGDIRIGALPTPLLQHLVEVGGDNGRPGRKGAYQLATNEITAPDAAGRLRTIAGKAVVIRRKEPDGAWRAVVDIWNGVGTSDAAALTRD
jgi:hypothetical protein